MRNFFLLIICVSKLAISGTININGQVINDTCYVSNDSEQVIIVINNTKCNLDIDNLKKLEITQDQMEERKKVQLDKINNSIEKINHKIIQLFKKP